MFGNFFFDVCCVNFLMFFDVCCVTSKKRHCFIWLLNKETFLHSPTFFE